MKRILGTLLITGMLASTLAGCGGTSAGGTASATTAAAATTAATSKAAETKAAETAAAAAPVHLLYMNNVGEDAAATWQDEMVTGFQTANPNVTVEIQRMGYDNYVTALQTKIASGDAPDLFMTEGEQMKTFNKNGYLADFSGEAFLTNFNRDDLALMTLDGKVVAIPTDSGSMLATYNKDAFKAAGITEVPATLDAFYAACEKLKAAGIAPIANGYKESWCLMADMQSDYITSVLAKDKNAILDLTSRKTTWVGNALWTDELQRVTDRFKYTSDDPFGTDWNGACDMVATGKAGMVLNGAWAITGIKGKNPDVSLGVFAVPFTNNAADTKLLIQAPSSGTAVYADSKNKEAAIAFVAYFSTPEAGSKLAKSAAKLSVVIGAEGPDEPAWQDLYKYKDAGMTFSQGAIDHNFPNEYRVAVETLVSKYLLDTGVGLDSLLKELDAEFDKIAASK